MSESLPATVTDWMRERVAKAEADRDLAMARVRELDEALAKAVQDRRQAGAAIDRLDRVRALLASEPVCPWSDESCSCLTCLVTEALR